VSLMGSSGCGILVLIAMHYIRLYTIDSSLSLFPPYVEFVTAEEMVSKISAGILLLQLLLPLLRLLLLPLLLLLIIIIIIIIYFQINRGF